METLNKNEKRAVVVYPKIAFVFDDVVVVNILHYSLNLVMQREQDGRKKFTRFALSFVGLTTLLSNFSHSWHSFDHFLTIIFPAYVYFVNSLYVSG